MNSIHLRSEPQRDLVVTDSESHSLVLAPDSWVAPVPVAVPPSRHGVSEFLKKLGSSLVDAESGMAESMAGTVIAT